ncbi:MAG TPA: cytochrome c3 family protein [Nitrospirota bacterium]
MVRDKLKSKGRISALTSFKGLTVWGILILLIAGFSLLLGYDDLQAAPQKNEDYVVIGWNDLGMHCISPSYKEVAILPPFNNLWVQVIQRGNPPKIVTSGITLEYSIVNNTKSAGKTDFWQYVQQLFGVSLTEGTGLTGNGLSGTMTLVGDHFEATGIPVTPYDDNMHWNPYQTAVVKLRTMSGGTPKKTEVVLPVSDEINCSQCHAQGMDGTVNLPVDPSTGAAGTTDVDLNILMVHDYYHGLNGVTSTGPNLVNMRPVLCAKCHPSNALGAPGQPGVKSLSLAMHNWHNGVQRAPDATCYSCHPGQLTQCLRTGIGGMGYLGSVPSCQTGSCHGGIAGVANPSREPWRSEPTCGQCHGINYSTGSDLYRHAKGHGGLYCAACHNSPHAWWPSKQWADNAQPMKLQHNAQPTGDCGVCHTDKLSGKNPHVTVYPAVK